MLPEHAPALAVSWVAIPGAHHFRVGMAGMAGIAAIGPLDGWHACVCICMAGVAAQMRLLKPHAALAFDAHSGQQRACQVFSGGPPPICTFT